MSYKDTVITANGNFQDHVYTTPHFMTSIESINISSKAFKKDSQTVYNLSDGAYFANTIPKKINNIDINSLNEINKDILDNEINNIFLLNSSNKMTNDEFALLKERYEYALKIDEIIFVQQKSHFKSYNNFLDSLKTIFTKLISNTTASGYDLAMTYHEYFKFINTYIFDFFNSTEIKNIDFHANEINKLLCDQLLRITNKYESELHSTIRNKEENE
jgi:hypothetical protein